MKFIVWLHYLLINLITYHKLPCWLNCDGCEWFNCIEKCYAIDCKWHIRYSRYDKNGDMIDLLCVEHKYKYIAYLLMVFELFRNRKEITYSIDYL